MKYKSTLSVFIILLLFSCGGSSSKNDLESKRNQLSKYKSQLEEIKNKISELEKEIAKLDTSTGNSLKSKIVSIDTLKLQPFIHYIELQGQVDSEENVFVSPEMPGIINSIKVKEGDKVGRGSVMATTEAGALLNTLEEVKTALALATTTYEKQKRLWDQKIGSEIQYLSAKTNKESLEARLAAVQSQINMTRIKSPISGTVDAVDVKLGEMCSPGMNGIRVVNLDKMKVVANVADTYLKKIKKGNSVIIELPDIGMTIESKISFVSQVINPRNRTISIEVKVPNKEKMIKPNMVAKVKINDEMIDTAIVIPSNIIQSTTDGTNYVLIAETENGKMVARKREITTGTFYAGNTMITSGLKQGDVIITSGYQEVVNGQPIYIK